MGEIQPIIYRGRMAALVVGGQAIIPDALPSREQTIVKAMCLYALEVGRRTAPPPARTAKRGRSRTRAQRRPSTPELNYAVHLFLAQQGAFWSPTRYLSFGSPKTERSGES
jgi:hypothetical protein